MISGLAAKIAARQFVVTGELTPPKGTDLTRLFATAELLRGCVDAINITESPRARMSMDARAVAKLLLRSRHRDHRADHEPRPQPHRRAVGFVRRRGAGPAQLRVHGRRFARRRRPSGCQAGVRPHGLGIAGRRRGLAQRQGLSPATRCTGTPDLFLGATCNPGAANFDAEVENTRRKIDAGARMLQTQAIYHADPLKRFIDAVKPDGVAILAGIIPLKSEKSGPWLNANLPGVVVPPDMLEAMEQAARDGKRAGAWHRARGARDPAR